MWAHAKCVAVVLAASALCVALSMAWLGRSRLRMAEDHSWLLLEARAENAALNTQQHLEDVPKVLHQTYIARERVPAKVWTNIASYAPEHEHRFYDDAAAERFLEAHYDARVVTAFRSFKFGAHKADLFRYAVLYICGGVYMDIKTQLVQRLDGLFPAGAVSTVISRKPVEIYQGIVAAPPRQPIFLALIDAAVRSGPAPPYNRFIRDFMLYVRKDVRSGDGGAVRPDALLRGGLHRYMLYSERCDRDAGRCEDGLDRYGWCCTVESRGARIVKTRYADFPW